MRLRILFLLTASLLTGVLSAQFTPQGFNYQSVVRDMSGKPMDNQPVTLLFTIRSGASNGPIAYSEKQVVTTNEFGLINLVIGQGGTPLQGAINEINWGGGAKFLTVSIETAPNVFDELGASQLMSVPYALYAQNAANAGSSGGDNWGAQNVQSNTTLSGNGTGGSPLGIAPQGAKPGQVLKWDGSTWKPGDDVSNTSTTGGTITQINTGAGLTGGPINTTGTISLNNTGVIPGSYGSASQIPLITVDAQGRVTSIGNTVASPGTIGLNGGPGIDVQQNGYNFNLTNTGDTDPSNDLTNSTLFNGDVSGLSSDLQLKANAVGSAEIANAAVGTADLANGAVTTDKIANSAVTGAKLDDMGASNGQVLKWNGGAWAPQPDETGISTLSIVAGSGISVSGSAPAFTIVNSGDTNAADDITTGSIANGDVSGAFSNLQLKANVVGNNELSDNAVGTNELVNGAVTAAKLDNMGAAAGQVLKWNGSAWAAAEDQGGIQTVVGILPGTGINISESSGTFTVINTGDTDPGNDLTNTSTAGGDVSGAFSNLQIDPGVVGPTELANNAVTNAKLANSAVSSAKLADNAVTNDKIANGAVTGGKIASLGAANGQVLKWNGTVWAPANDLTGGGTGGDNWGTQVVVTGAALGGSGTNASPLNLAQQGAANGQVLKWNGSAWAPAADLTGAGGNSYAEGAGISITGTAPNFTITNTGDLSSTNEIQTLELTNSVLSLSNGGGSVNLPIVNNYLAGTGLNLTGSSPNFTFNNTGDLSETNEIQTLTYTGATRVLSLSKGGGNVTLPAPNSYNEGTGINITGSAPNFTIENTGDLSSTNELQTIAFNNANNQLSLSNGGGTVTLPANNRYTAGTGISITGTSPNFTVTNTGDLSTTNELQTLSLSGTTLSLSVNNSSIDLAGLVGTGTGVGWSAVSSHIFNNNTGNVLIGKNTNAFGKLQVAQFGAGSAASFTNESEGNKDAVIYAATAGNGPAASLFSNQGPALVTSGGAGAGNVGISTNSPLYRLDVKGDGRYLGSDSKPQLTLEHQTNGLAKMLFKSNGNSSWQLSGKTQGNNGDFTLDFAGASANQSARVMTIQEDGNTSFGAPGNAGSRTRIYHGNRGLLLHSPDTLKKWEFWVNSTNGTLSLFNQTLGTAIPAGTFATNGVYTPSDRRLKKDIAVLPDNILSKVLQLNPVYYRYTAENASSKKSLGFLAQEVDALFPELVAENPDRNENASHLSLNYAGFGVLAVKAVQEQQKEIEQLRQENEILRKKMDEIEKLLKEIKRN